MSAMDQQKCSRLHAPDVTPYGLGFE
jgi:hypothetical protein